MNSECQNFPCCSFGYCSSSYNLCQDGLKEDFDMCDVSTECKSGNCVNNRCATSMIETQSNLTWIEFLVIFGLIVFITAVCCLMTKSRYHTYGLSGGYYSREKGEKIKNLRH